MKPEDVPEGRYAIKHGHWEFFIVQHGKGRWDGYVFIQRLVGAPGGFRKVAMPANARISALAEIKADPKEAAIQFGLQTRTCSICGSGLTNEDSIAAGIGPICRSKVGW